MKWKILWSSLGTDDMWIVEIVRMIHLILILF